MKLLKNFKFKVGFIKMKNAVAEGSTTASLLKSGKIICVRVRRSVQIPFRILFLFEFRAR